MPIPIPHFADRDAIDHARRWREHVEAGRIGVCCRPTASLLEAGPSTQTPEQVERHAHNARVVKGRLHDGGRA